MATTGQEDATVELELLARRLARLEARVHGSAADSSTNTTNACTSTDLRARLQAAARRVAANAEAVGEVGARQQLEREMLLLPSSSSSSSSSSSLGLGLGLMAPPPSHGALLGVEEKAALLLAQEEELGVVLDALQRVERLRGCVEQPWPVLGGGLVCLFWCCCCCFGGGGVLLLKDGMDGMVGWWID
jgi:hypothetical protein